MFVKREIKSCHRCWE